MGLTQRILEKSGLVTVSLANMPFTMEKIGVPRCVAVEFPFGMIWGLPGDHGTHKEIMEYMLNAVEDIKEPGTIVELSLTWPDEEFEKRNWLPTEPTPWMSSPEALNEMMKFIQHGNPME